MSKLCLGRLSQGFGLYKMVLILSAISLLIVFSYSLGLQDTIREYPELLAKERALRSEFEIKFPKAANSKAYRKHFSEMKKRFGVQLRALPSQNEIPSLLEEISKIGASLGLKFELFSPQEEVNHDFYLEVPIKITTVGSYVQCATFISRVAQMDRIVTLHELSLHRFKGKTQIRSLEAPLEMALIAKIYRYAIP